MLSECLIAGFIGMLLQIFLVKLPSLKLRFQKANEQLTIGRFFRDEWITLCGSVLVICALVYCLDEMLNLRPELLKVIKWLFIFVGFTGSSIMMALFSRTSKTLNAIIDVKTDIADDKTSAT